MGSGRGGGWKWSGSLCGGNRVQCKPVLVVDCLDGRLPPLIVVSSVFVRVGIYPLVFTGMVYNNF